MIRVTFIINLYELRYLSVRDGRDAETDETKLTTGIYEKMLKHPLQLPYLPTSSMYVDLTKFYDYYGFTQIERDILNSLEQVTMKLISFVVINPGGLTIYV